MRAWVVVAAVSVTLLGVGRASAQANGSACTDSGECLSGFCVDQVCCEGECGGPCRRCDWAGPEGTPDGLCRVPAGDDPDGDCGGTGDCRGVCAADGSCSHPGWDRRCARCTACDGAGGCNQLPLDSDDPDCGTLSCDALSTDCRTYAPVSRTRCVAVGFCASPGDAWRCTEHTDWPDGTPCSWGECRGGECVTADHPASAGAAGACDCAAGARPRLYRGRRCSGCWGRRAGAGARLQGG